MTHFPLTEPEIVLSLNATEITTSSVYVTWTEPKGNRSFYRVQWTNGTKTQTVNVSETNINVTELTAGVKYTFTVTAVADDNQTESETAESSHYTSKMTNMIFADHIASNLFCVILLYFCYVLHSFLLSSYRTRCNWETYCFL